MILPNMDRQDIWDRLVNPNVARDRPAWQPVASLEIRPVEAFVCPSDTDATSNVESRRRSPTREHRRLGSSDQATGFLHRSLLRRHGRHARQRHLPEPRRSTFARTMTPPTDANLENPRRREHHDHALGKRQQGLRARRQQRALTSPGSAAPIDSNATIPSSAPNSSSASSGSSTRIRSRRQSFDSITDQERINRDTASPPIWSANDSEFRPPGQQPQRRRQRRLRRRPHAIPPRRHRLPRLPTPDDAQRQKVRRSERIGQTKPTAPKK